MAEGGNVWWKRVGKKFGVVVLKRFSREAAPGKRGYAS